MSRTAQTFQYGVNNPQMIGAEQTSALDLFEIKSSSVSTGKWPF